MLYPHCLSCLHYRFDSGGLLVLAWCSLGALWLLSVSLSVISWCPLVVGYLGCSLCRPPRVYARSLSERLGCSLGGFLGCSLGGSLGCSLCCSLGGFLAGSLGGSMCFVMCGFPWYRQVSSLGCSLGCSLVGCQGCFLGGDCCISLFDVSIINLLSERRYSSA